MSHDQIIDSIKHSRPDSSLLCSGVKSVINLEQPKVLQRYMGVSEKRLGPAEPNLEQQNKSIAASSKPMRDFAERNPKMPLSLMNIQNSSLLKRWLQPWKVNHET